MRALGGAVVWRDGSELRQVNVRQIKARKIVLTGLCANGVETDRPWADFRKSSLWFECPEFSRDLMGVGVILGVDGASDGGSLSLSAGNSSFSASRQAACTIPNLLDAV